MGYRNGKEADMDFSYTAEKPFGRSYAPGSKSTCVSIGPPGEDDEFISIQRPASMACKRMYEGLGGLHWPEYGRGANLMP
jgi:hypothetical protein